MTLMAFYRLPVLSYGLWRQLLQLHYYAHSYILWQGQLEIPDSNTLIPGR